MEKRDHLEVLEGLSQLAEAVTRSVAYNSPSPVEDIRQSFNSEVLALRDELDLDEHDQPRVHEEANVEDPAEEEDAFEEHPGDTDLLEPQPDQAPPAEEPVEAQVPVETPAPVAEGVSEPAAGDTLQA